MVDRGKRAGKHRPSTSSYASSEFDTEYREQLEGRYLCSTVDVRPPSGTNHQQPGSHLSIDTRLSELSLANNDASSDRLLSQSHTAQTTKARPKKLNCYVTSPFKQGYHVPKAGPHKPIVDPSIELKRVTRESVELVRRQFTRSKPPVPPSLHLQRLKKAKLKHTGRPVSGSGPSIQQCRGIQAGRQVISRTAAPIVYFKDERPVTALSFTRPESPTEMRRPESSIHCTSRASSMTDQDSLLDECFNEVADLSRDDNLLDPNEHSPSRVPSQKDTKTTNAIDNGNHTSTCKPFSDGKYHRHDDDDDEIPHRKLLQSNYNNHSQNSRNQTNQDNEFKLGTGTGKGVNDKQPNQDTIQPKTENQTTLLTDRCVHAVDSTPRIRRPVLTVHVRTKLESAALESCDSNHSIPNKEMESHDDIDYVNDGDSFYLGGDSAHGDDVDNHCNDADNNGIDTDRIPSALIWKNLDQLNLSMNASSSKCNQNSRTRKVKSAGQFRDHSRVDSVLKQDNHVKQTSSNKPKKTKKNSTKPREEVDKAELLRKYLSDECQKFCADLPGYFTEQFHIIQEGRKGSPEESTVEGKQEVCKALVKYEGDGDDSDGAKQEEPSENHDTDFKEADDTSTSFGVFFTVDSTSGCDVDSLSGPETLEEDSIDSREFSDDTGFETMPSTHILHHEKPVPQLPDLEVVAKAKLLTDPKPSNAYVICSYEPLKFAINGRPPPGYLFYFAYGADMNCKRMSLYLRGEHEQLWGVLFGFKLRFNKKGSSRDAGGFANIEFCAGSSVEGCIYTITDEELSMLDNCMGYPKHYIRVVLPVWMSNCYQPSLHGVAQYCIPAVLYVAEQQWVQTGPTDTLDCTYSVGQCLKASHILSPNYVEFLNQLAA